MARHLVDSRPWADEVEKTDRAFWRRGVSFAGHAYGARGRRDSGSLGAIAGHGEIRGTCQGIHRTSRVGEHDFDFAGRSLLSTAAQGNLRSAAGALRSRKS